MDSNRFDNLTRRLAEVRSRRGTLLGLVSGSLGLFGVAEVVGKRKHKKKKKKRQPPSPPPASPPNLPPPNPCPQAAAPHFCASANTCVPVCPSDKVFEASSCQCVCTEPSCVSTICGTADQCISGATACGIEGGQCYQPLGGGPTRCGVNTMNCGCDSHQFCSEGFGAGAFCATFTPPGVGDCFCSLGRTTFCVLPK